MKRILMVLLLVVVLGAAALPAFATGAPVASVNTGTLNVRTGPGMQFGSIATLPFGFGVNMIGRNSGGDWILIALTNGVTGWVNQGLLFTQFPTHSLPVTDLPVAPTVTPSANVTGAFVLNVRVGPSTDNAVIKTIPIGTHVVLLGRNYNSMWAEIQLADGTVGWVETFSLTATVPVRSLTLADGSVFVPNAPSLPINGQPGGTAGGSQIYVVRPGDTLSTIAQRFGVSMFAIAAVNHIFNFNLIFIDQQLIIPA